MKPAQAPCKGHKTARINRVLANHRFTPTQPPHHKGTVMNDLEELMPQPIPTAARPLLGRTILVVEDSRFACEAMRLLCMRSGARLRRADCLASARRHLLVFRPTIVIADLGLPDGCGADLLHELAQASPRITALLGMSGDPSRESEAIAAGADGFLAKPVESLAAFQELILAHLPPDMQPAGLRPVDNDQITPDPLAYHDDIAHACEVLNNKTDAFTLDYVAQFTAGVARSANDRKLMVAAQALAQHRTNGSPVRSDLARLAGLLQDRLAARRAVI